MYFRVDQVSNRTGRELHKEKGTVHSRNKESQKKWTVTVNIYARHSYLSSLVLCIIIYHLSFTWEPRCLAGLRKMAKAQLSLWVCLSCFWFCNAKKKKVELMLGVTSEHTCVLRIHRSSILGLETLYDHLV